MDDREENFGIVIAGADGQVLFQSGLGENPGIRSAVLESFRNGDKQSAIQNLAVGSRRYVITSRTSAGATAFLIHETAGEEGLFGFIDSVDFAYSILNYMLGDPYQGLTVVDAEAKVRYLSHLELFGLPGDKVIGKDVTEVIENTRLDKVIRSGKAEIGQIHKLGGVDRIVRRIPIFDRGRLVGAFSQMMFKGPEQLHELSRRIAKLQQEVTFYRRELSGVRNRSYGLDQIVGKSAAVASLKSDIIRVAPLGVAVLIAGESGTGKELVAQAIHSLSPRHASGMVLVNAAALPASLVESELFGYEAGAFTGADRKGRQGKFEQANNSSIFLDEIGEMPVEIQVKLLRVLQNGMFERIGGDRSHYSDFRLIAATNADLEQMIECGKFRLDLFYRISGVVLKLPPLRERLEDIPDLVRHFLAEHARRHHCAEKRVHGEVYHFLRQLDWPGNIRQLQHEVEKAAIFSNGNEITVEDFRSLSRSRPSAEWGEQRPGTMQKAVGDMEMVLINDAMARLGGNKKRVAEELGISRSYLYKKLSGIY